jgi:hypothetical protein
MAEQSFEIRQIPFVKEPRAVVNPDPDGLSGYRLQNDQISILIAIHVAGTQLDGCTRAQETERGLLEGAQRDADFLGIAIGIMAPGPRGREVDILVPVEIGEHPSGHLGGVKGARKILGRNGKPTAGQG